MSDPCTSRTCIPNGDLPDMRFMRFLTPGGVRQYITSAGDSYLLVPCEVEKVGLRFDRYLIRKVSFMDIAKFRKDRITLREALRMEHSGPFYIGDYREGSKLTRLWSVTAGEIPRSYLPPM